MTANSTVSPHAGADGPDGSISVPFSVRNGTDDPKRRHPRPAQVLTRAEVNALMRQCSIRTPSGARHRALIAVGYCAGLRCGEALALTPADIDPVAATVRVLHGKGDQARTVGINAGGLDSVARWLDVRRGLGVPVCRAPLPPEKTCPECGEPFYRGESGRLDALYCSKLCGTRARVKRWRERHRRT